MWWMKAGGYNPLGLPSSTSSPQVPRSLQARVWSCLAHAWDEKSLDPDGITVNIDSIYRAAECADIAAELGFVSPVTITLGTKITNMRARLPNSDPKLSLDAPRFKELHFFWKAHEDRMQEYEKELSKREVKTARRPAAYLCAAVGCGIEATSKSGLMRCSGKCPVDLKPSYCSKECQRKVRIRSVFTLRRHLRR